MADAAVQQTPTASVDSRSDVSPLAATFAALLLVSFALFQGLGTKNARDFFIYRLGPELALHGENPYEVAKTRQHVAEVYPEDDKNTQEFVANCGYFLPPLALVLFMPLAVVPATAAKVAWALASGGAAYFVARLPGTLRSANPLPLNAIARFVVPVILVLNPLCLAIVMVGQSSLLSLGCIAAGLLCLERGRVYLCALLWVFPFVKPHMAIPLIPLLWYLGGWRPAVLLLVLVAALNVAGATVVGGSPLFLRDYLESLSEAHKTVGFNRAESNPHLTSWNRLLLTAGGPIVELNAVTTLAGYLVWFGLVVGRTAISGVRPSASWVVAAAAVGTLLCSQVLLYEVLILALVVPWVRDLFAAGCRVRGWLATSLLTIHLVPWMTLEELGIVIPPSLEVFLLSLLILASPCEKSDK